MCFNRMRDNALISRLKNAWGRLTPHFFPVCEQVAMFRNTFQSGFLSILYSIGSKPLQVTHRNPCRNRDRSPSSVPSRSASCSLAHRSGTRRCAMGTLSASRTRTFRAPCWRSWARTFRPTTLRAPPVRSGATALVPTLAHRLSLSS